MIISKTEMEEWAVKRSKMLLCFILLLVGSSGYALAEGIVSDSTHLIRLSKHSWGVVFPESYAMHDVSLSKTPRFTPSDEEIFLVEKLLLSQYNSAYENFPQSEPIVWNPVNAQRKLKHYYRQYVGFYNEKGEKVVFVHLMNFKRKKLAKEKFKGWQHEMVIGNHGFYDKNRETFDVNITQQRASLGGVER